MRIHEKGIAQEKGESNTAVTRPSQEKSEMVLRKLPSDPLVDATFVVREREVRRFALPLDITNEFV